MSENFDEEISTTDNSVGMPFWIRLTVCIISGLFVLLSALLFILYILNPNIYASPKELQLNTIIIFNLAVFFVTIIPLESMGIRIRKIGQIEFEQIINVQAREHAEELAEIRTQIHELEKEVSASDSVNRIIFEMSSPQLRKLVFDFLTNFQPAAYSPVRIREWGAKQPGFEKLGTISIGNMRAILQGLLLEGKVSTSVSKLGNTLYKVKNL